MARRIMLRWFLVAVSRRLPSNQFTSAPCCLLALADGSAQSAKNLDNRIIVHRRVLTPATER